MLPPPREDSSVGQLEANELATDASEELVHAAWLHSPLNQVSSGDTMEEFEPAVPRTLSRPDGFRHAALESVSRLARPASHWEEMLPYVSASNSGCVRLQGNHSRNLGVDNSESCSNCNGSDGHFGMREHGE